MEIVFEPDLFDGEESASLIKELSLILQVIWWKAVLTRHI